MKNTPINTFQTNRRDFLKKSAAIGALKLIPASFILGKKGSAKELPPSERVNVAAIGIGNQGGNNIGALHDTGMCNIVALCDVDLEGKHTKKSQAQHPKAKKFTDFRKMFDEMSDEIDAVLVATPDHSHFSAAMLAMSLGKAVYVQKPLAHTFGQCRRLMDMAKRSGVVTQMGNQGRSGGAYYQFQEWLKAGVIKDITRIDATMVSARRWHKWGMVTEYPTGPVPDGMNLDVWYDYAPERPFSKDLHPGDWRSWFEYGSGAFGDWGPHILDNCHQFLELGLPHTVEAVKLEGHSKLVYPMASTIRFSFAARGDMPACELNWHDGQGNYPEIPEELGDLQKDGTRAPVKIPTEGKILYGKDLTFMGGAKSSPLYVLPKEKFMEMRKDLPQFQSRGISKHFENFLLAVKGEEEARSDFSVAAPLCQVFNLGMISQRLGGKFTFDPKTQQITDNPVANALLDPAPRPGWEEFYRM